MSLSTALSLLVKIRDIFRSQIQWVYVNTAKVTEVSKFSPNSNIFPLLLDSSSFTHILFQSFSLVLLSYFLTLKMSLSVSSTKRVLAQRDSGLNHTPHTSQTTHTCSLHIYLTAPSPADPGPRLHVGSFRENILTLHLDLCQGLGQQAGAAWFLVPK